MGNPVSTRLGIRQFWYRHWYTDSTRTLNLKQDEAFEELISIYLQYGITIKTNPLVHEYWYRRQLKNIRVTAQTKINSQYYRRFFYTNDVLSIEHSYLIRNKTAEYFPMRTWILRYGGWLVFSVQWFKPLKIKTKKKIPRSRSSNYVGAVVKSTPATSLTKRVKLLLLLSIKNSSSTYYF